MLIRRILHAALVSLTPFAFVLGCDQPEAAGLDANGDGVADDLGKTIDRDGNGFADEFDVDGDGTADGPGVDMNGDGVFDGVLLDADCDGIFESVDTNGDGSADFVTSRGRIATNVPGCNSGSGGSAGSGGSSGSGGSGGSAGGGPSELGNASYQGTGSSSDRYAESDVYRNGVGYKFMANGWGTGWQSHQISWNGTSFEVVSLNGNQGADYSPAGYPTVFCGNYSQKQSIGSCGLPASISSLSAVRTGWRWAANGNNGQYNAAWDIWIGNGTNLSSFLMVWLRDPPGQQPAGSGKVAGATVDGLPGTWSIWTGSVSPSGRPIVSYVRTEGQDLGELEFDVLAVYRDAIGRGYALPGSDIMSVAVGFEVWNGPIANLETADFYVDVN